MKYALEKFGKKEIAYDLHGKDLLCCCTPLRCHGDWLLLIASVKMRIWEMPCRDCEEPVKYQAWSDIDEDRMRKNAIPLCDKCNPYPFG